MKKKAKIKILLQKINLFCRNIKENVKYYLAFWWMHSFFYRKIAYPAIRLGDMISKYESKRDAIRHSDIGYYKYLSKRYKKKIIDDYFG